MKVGISDEDIAKQIDHMIAFIDQEAEEKIDEIRSKADEEFEIEKGKLVQQQHSKIQSHYERKLKLMEQQKKVQQSQLTNAARLNILKFREDYIQVIVDEARNRLSEIRKNKENYTELLAGLISQGLFQILEDSVIVKCMQEDVALVQVAIPKAVSQLKESADRDVEVSVNMTEYLTPDTCGGVEMGSQNNSIRVRNTLDLRLQLIVTQMMPEIRAALYGKNPNRKFLS